MSFTALMITSVIIIVVITLMFIVATNRGYKFEHTVDPLPNNKDDEKEPTSKNRPD